MCVCVTEQHISVPTDVISRGLGQGRLSRVDGSLEGLVSLFEIDFSNFHRVLTSLSRSDLHFPL